MTEDANDEIGFVANGINSLLAVKDAYARDLSSAHGDLITYLAAIPFSLVLFDSRGHLIDANERAMQLFTNEFSNGFEISLWNLSFLQKRNNLKDILSTDKNLIRPITFPNIIVDTTDGRKIYDVVINTIDTSYHQRRYLMTAIDVTEKHLLQAQLANSQKLESIGQLAAGIAHEINTPSQYVSDNVRFLGEATHSLINLITNLKSHLNLYSDDSANKIK